MRWLVEGADSPEHAVAIVRQMLLHRTHSGQASASASASASVFEQLDPKNVLPKDVYDAANSDQGKQIMSGLGNLTSAVASGDPSAVWGTAEAIIIAAATAANPLAGTVVGAAFAIIDSLPKAKGAGAPQDNVCPQGHNRVGPPTSAVMALWTDPTEPSYAGGPEKPGTFLPWLGAFVDAAGNDPFLRAMATYVGIYRGKDENCYSDVIDEHVAMLIALTAWNAKAGPKQTITRSIRGDDHSRPRPTFGGKFAGYEPGPIPDDWDAVDRAYGDGEWRDDDMDTVNHPPGYAAIAKALWRHQHPDPNDQGPDHAKGESVKVSFQVRIPTAEDVAKQGGALPAHMKLKGHAQPKRPIGMSVPASASSTKSLVPFIPAGAGLVATLAFGLSPIVALAGLVATLWWRTKITKGASP